MPPSAPKVSPSSSWPPARASSRCSSISCRTAPSTGAWSRCFISTSTSACHPRTPPAFSATCENVSSLTRRRCRRSHFICGEGDPAAEYNRLNALTAPTPVDLAFIGIGENGHLAFTDPPANFDTEIPYLVLPLDETCRRQQMGEGWFTSMNLVPPQAISRPIQHILKSAHIVGSVPDARKAHAERDCLQGPVTNLHPSSILQTHPRCEFTSTKPPPPCSQRRSSADSHQDKRGQRG